MSFLDAVKLSNFTSALLFGSQETALFGFHQHHVLFKEFLQECFLSLNEDSTFNVLCTGPPEERTVKLLPLAELIHEAVFGTNNHIAMKLFYYKDNQPGERHFVELPTPANFALVMSACCDGQLVMSRKKNAV